MNDKQYSDELFQLADDGIAVHDARNPAVEAQLVEVNPALCEMLGYSSGELLDMRALDIIAPEDREAAREVSDRLREEDSVRHERTLLTNDGRRLPTEIISRRFEHDGQQMVMSVIRDITRRKEKDEALSRSQKEQADQREFLETLLNSAQACIGVLEGDELRFVMANRHYQALRPEVDLVGRPYPEVFPEATDKGVPELLRQVMRTGEAQVDFGRDMSVPGRPDASWDYRVVGLPVEEGQGKRILVIRWEVTEHKRAQEALKQSEQRLRLAASAARLGSFARDLKAGTDYWSSEFLEMFGVESEEELDMADGVPATVHAGDREKLAREWQEQLNSPDEPDFETEHRVVLPGGDVRWVYLRGRMQFNAKGAPIRVFGFVQDITERKAGEQELARSRSDLQRAQSVGKMGSWRLNLKDDDVEWSRECYRIFGVPQGSPLDYAEFLQCVHPDDRNMVDTRWQKALLGEPYDVEHRILRNGQVRWVRAKAYLEYDEQGEMDSAFGITHDITARKEAEQALREANETLEQRVAERTAEVQAQAEQLRALAHELGEAEQRERKRLAQILHDHIQQHIVAAQMQLEALIAEPDGEDASNRAGRVHGLLQDAFDASRNLAVDLSPPVLNEGGLEDALAWLAHRMREKNEFQVELSTDPDAEPESPQTKRLLFQCVRELLFNAVKHSGQDSAEVELGRTDGDNVRVVVADHGLGFNVASLDERTPNDTTFGLFSIRERLAYIGGQMKIRSAPGDGTQIELVAPAGTGREDAEPDSESPQTPDTRIKVVVAEDHEPVRRMVVDRINDEDDMIVVGQTGDGHEVVDLARELRPDVVVMDMRLPGIDGPEATRRIRRERPGVHIIGHTAYSTPERVEIMHSRGAVACVCKNSSCEKLLSAIRQAQSGSVDDVDDSCRVCRTK